MSNNDELMHPQGPGGSWSESYYFNFIDPDQKIGMFTRMGFRPDSGWADALHVVYLGGKRLAFTYGRREIQPELSRYNGNLQAGDLTIECAEPFKLWRIRYSGPAQDIANGAVLLERRKLRRPGWFAEATLDMTLTFQCLTDPHYAARGDTGHFEQSGRVQGSIAITGPSVSQPSTDHKSNRQSWQVSGYGVRDKSWGPRDWGANDRKPDTNQAVVAADQPAPFVNWFSMNFGEDIALGGSAFRHPDGVIRGEGWYQADGTSTALRNVVVHSEYEADSILHKSVRLTATTEDGRPLDITGRILSVCPTKIAMPGGATFINEGLAEFTLDGRIGYGIAEHWHAVDKP